MVLHAALLSLSALQLSAAPVAASLPLAPQAADQDVAEPAAIDSLAGTIWIVPPAQPGLFLAIEFPEDLSNQALVTMPQLGIRRPMMIAPATDRAGLSLTPADAADAPTLKIEIEASGRQFKARWGVPDEDGLLTTVLGSSDLERWIQPRDFPDFGVYSGKLELPAQFGGQLLDVILALGHGPEGASATISIPLQNLDAYPAVATHEGNSWSITANFGSTIITIDLDATDEEGDLAGIMSQAGMDMKLTLRRLSAEAQDPRPQTPKPPFPYQASEVRIPAPQGHLLAGTLLLPDGVEEPPVVVLITGSGPQDRDETVMGHKPFLVLADALARRGIASLRYDDRGVSESTGDHAAALTTDFADDAVAAVEWLRERDDVSSKWIGLIGHSEGGVVAPIAISRDPDIAFAVLMAGTGVDGGRILTSQTKRIMEVAGTDQADIDRVISLHESLMDATRDSVDLEELLRRYLLLTEAQIEVSLGGAGEQYTDDRLLDLRTTVAEMKRTGQSPFSDWLQAFIRLDPRSYLARMRCPVLAINGSNDVQVLSDLNLPEIERAITTGGGDVTIIEYEGLNHLFQKSDTGAVEEYASIRTTMEPAVIKDIADWILKTTGRTDS